MIDPNFAKAYNRLSNCHIALGDLPAASVALQKSIDLEPKNPTNKRDQKKLNDIKIIESLVNKALAEEMYEKAVTNLTQLLEDCTQSIKHVCLKIECLMKAYKFEEADQYSASIMKKGGDIANHPQFMC